MILKGKYEKSGKHWLIEIPSLGAMSQGTSKKDAFFMIKDWLLEMTEDRKLGMEIADHGKGDFSIKFSHTSSIVSLMLSNARKNEKITYEMVQNQLGLASKSVAKSRFDKKDKLLEKLSQTANCLGYDLVIDLVKKDASKTS
jgi:predicted RNase H-like HicB family nuclease